MCWRLLRVKWKRGEGEKGTHMERNTEEKRKKKGKKKRNKHKNLLFFPQRERSKHTTEMKYKFFLGDWERCIYYKCHRSLLVEIK